MLSRPRLIVPILALLAALPAGCGGTEQSGGSQEGGQEEQQQPEKEAQETKIAIGNVVAVQPDRRRMVVQPSQQAEGTEKIAINVRKTAEITLGDQEAEMADVAEGQQAQARYVVKNDVNRAVSVQLFEADGEGTSN